MGQLERKDFISDVAWEALTNPMILTKGLEAVLDVQGRIIMQSKEMSKALESGGSTEKIKKSIEDLSLQEKELLKTREAISKENAKNNDTQRALNETLAKAKQANKEAQASTDAWTKSVNAQNSSLTDLEKALTKNRTAYAALRGEESRHSEGGKKLLSVIQQQAKDQDKLRTSMVQTQHRVGSYNETLEQFHRSAERIAPALRKIAPEALEAGEAVGGFGAKLFAIVSSPVTLLLTSVAVVFGTIAEAAKAFFSETVEGQERAAQAGVTWSATLEVVEERMKKIGKAVADFFGIGEGSFSGFTTGFLSFLGMTKLAAEIVAKEVILNEKIKLQNELRREEIKLTTELAEINLAKDKAMFEARDKVRNTDQERFDQLKESVKLGKEGREAELKSLALQIEIVRKSIEAKGVILDKDKKTFELLQDTAITEKVGFELLEQYAKLQARVFEIEDKRYQGARRRQALEKTIIADVIKRETDAAEGVQDAIVKQQEIIYTQLTTIHSKIISNQNFTVNEQIAASEKLTQAQIGLADIGASKELAAARKSALARIEISGEAAREIYDDETLTLAQKVKREEEEKEKLLKINQTYQDQVKAIQEKAQAEQQRLLSEGAGKTGKIIVDNYKYFAAIRKQFVKEDTNAELAALNKQFTDGNVGIIAYQKRKLALEQSMAQESASIDAKEYNEALNALEAFLKSKGTLTKEEGEALTALRLEASNMELAATEKDAAKKLDIYKRAKAKTIQIVSELASAIQAAYDAQYTAELAASQRRLDLLDREHEQSLKAAGDNKNAVAGLDREYTKKLNAETEKQNAIKRRQAKFDKIAAEFKVVSSTAAGIAQAYEEFPYPVATVFAVLIGAVAALQLAAIAKAPLPSYEVGTSNHPGGPAIVGHGIELVREPGRKPFIVSRPEVLNLARGTEVLTNDETMATLAMAGLARSGNGDRQVPPIMLNFQPIINELRRLQMPDIFEQQGEVMKAYRTRDGGRQIIRSKWTF
jgi:hypothetical protein